MLNIFNFDLISLILLKLSVFDKLSVSLCSKYFFKLITTICSYQDSPEHIEIKITRPEPMEIMQMFKCVYCVIFDNGTHIEETLNFVKNFKHQITEYVINAKWMYINSLNWYIFSMHFLNSLYIKQVTVSGVGAIPLITFDKCPNLKKLHIYNPGLTNNGIELSRYLSNRVQTHISFCRNKNQKLTLRINS